MDLASKYFSILSKRVQGDIEYVAIRPLDNPLILFSLVDGSPLASFHLRCQDNRRQNDYSGNRGRALICARPYNSQVKCNFQGLINRDNQEFEFVITNLCSEGMINFNILKTDSKVEEVNPGGVNQVNELRPYESYEVQCDQSDRRVMILRAIKGADGKANLTIEQAEKTDAKPQGAYFYLSVVPEIGKTALEDKFRATAWACVDAFVLKTKARKIVSRGIPRSLGFGSRDAGFVIERCSMPVPMSASIDEVCAVRSYMTDGDFEEERLEMDSAPMSKGLSQQSASGIRGLSQQSARGTREDVIKDSYASTVIGGEEISVSSAFTGIEYNYDLAAAPCVVCLSVSDKLEFWQPSSITELVKECEEMIRDMIENDSKDLLKRLTTVYKETRCTICMDGDEDENPNDVVFYTCGHQCCHAECSVSLDRCPLCRSSITASIKV